MVRGNVEFDDRIRLLDSYRYAYACHSTAYGKVDQMYSTLNRLWHPLDISIRDTSPLEVYASFHRSCDVSSYCMPIG